MKTIVYHCVWQMINIDPVLSNSIKSRYFSLSPCYLEVCPYDPKLVNLETNMRLADLLVDAVQDHVK